MVEKDVIKNQAVERLLSIIEVMAKSTLPLRIQDIATEADVPTSTALRLVNTLLSLGYAAQDERTLRYYLTLKFSYIGAQVASRFPLNELIRPYLHQLSVYSGELSCLSAQAGINPIATNPPLTSKIVTLDIVNGQNDTLQVVRQIGGQALMHCSGVGKLILLDRSVAELEAYVRAYGLTAKTPKSITTFQQLTDALRTIRLRGYALDDEESALGIRSVAVPIKDYSNHTVCGISIAGPCIRLTYSRIEELLPELRRVATEASALLGGTYPSPQAE
ncbi:MAG: IclR family transcriptional regulator [Oscillospiraceae bacterium]|nr:IclR family transcriptional regulator [Oscillospiraceae bacterium]